ncbi:trypsin-like peptidase domain-containing protein [Candidatus Parcubacteria bacterium]|nr:trypsin-like peptidase domain-containing protein [Candidatus Parcubacteria bacterium]
MTKELSVVDIVKKVCPAVITIIVSKNLPKIEGFYMFPFGGQKLVMPKISRSAGSASGGKIEKEMIKIGGGSGFIVSSDGFVITSQHVVGDPKAEYTVVLSPKKKYPAKVLARDPINDIAILKIQGKNFPYLELGDLDKIELGESVIAVGNALGEFDDTVSTGVVSGLSRYITATDPVAFQAERLKGLIQTDAAINPGNSGGPLINMEGRVIGVNTATVMGAQNIGFAIPINYVKEDLEEIKKYGRLRTPFLGLKYVLISKEMAEKNKLSVDYGALVIRESLGESPIVKGSTADKAGIKEFDIILECEGKKITLKNPLRNILQEFEINKIIALKILRPARNASPARQPDGSHGGGHSDAGGGMQEKIIKVKLEEKK